MSTAATSTTSLPPAHPDIAGHEHYGGTCPVAGKSHQWCPAQKHDSRSPCPALNTLANHGYLPRNGKNISVWDLVRALREGYRLSLPLALLLAVGGVLLLGQFSALSLADLARHNRIEHDASLVHADTPREAEYAPARARAGLIAELLRDACDVGGRRVFRADDIARARVRRERTSHALDGVHAEVARGEMAIVLGMWGRGAGIPADMLREWMEDERLPAGWAPARATGLIETVMNSNRIRGAMERIRKVEVDSAPGCLVKDEKTAEDKAPLALKLPPKSQK